MQFSTLLQQSLAMETGRRSSFVQNKHNPKKTKEAFCQYELRNIAAATAKHKKKQQTEIHGGTIFTS